MRYLKPWIGTVVRIIVMTLCFMTGWAAAQESAEYSSWLPRPYVAGGLSLMPDGYHSTAWRAQGGLYVTEKHFISDTYVAYDNGKKVNDNTLNNLKGHDRYMASWAAYRHRSLFYAGGFRWSQLSTTNFIKELNLPKAIRQGEIRPQFGVGKDWVGNFSARGQVLYVMTPLHEGTTFSNGTFCNGCGNGLQGPEFTLIFPSPVDVDQHGGRYRWFFRMSLGIFEYHDTVTEPSNSSLTAEQTANRHATATTDFMVMWRF